MSAFFPCAGFRTGGQQKYGGYGLYAAGIGRIYRIHTPQGIFRLRSGGMLQLPQEVPAVSVPEEEPAGTCRFDFDINGIDEDGFPFHQWGKISRQVLREGPKLFRLGDPRGEKSLRCVLASYLHHARGVSCSPEQIVVGAGNDYLLMLLRVILGGNRRIAMENPTYKSAFLCFSHLGYEVMGIGMDACGMRVEELKRSGADTAYVMPSPSVSMGSVIAAETADAAAFLGVRRSGKVYSGR